MILDYKGINIHYTYNGTGKAVVLLHGFLENLSIWNPFIEELSKKNRIICIDLLGHGQSGCLGFIHPMEMMAEAVYAVLKHLKIDSCVIVGHSMGGYVLLAFMEKYPEQTNGIFLVNSTASADSVERKQNRDRAIAAVKQDHKTFIRIAIANLFNPEKKEESSKDIKNITQEALKTPLQGIVAALEGMKIRKDRKDILKDYTNKKWIIISKKDPVLDSVQLQKEAKETGLMVNNFPDGHMSFIENKGLFFQKIMHFIEN